MRGRGGTRGESIDRHQITKWYRRLTVSGKQWPKKFPFFGPPVDTLPKNLTFFAPPIYALPIFGSFLGKLKTRFPKKRQNFGQDSSLEPPHGKQDSQCERRIGQKIDKNCQKKSGFLVICFRESARRGKF